MSALSAPATDLLRIDAAAETDRIGLAIRDIVLSQFRRKGAVVAVSGGIDSAVVAALCARGLGPEKVIALFLPEANSSGESLRLGQLLVQKLGIRSFCENITPMLE